MPEIAYPQPAFEKLGTKEITSLGYNILRLARGNDKVVEAGCHYLGHVYHGQLTAGVLDEARPTLEKAVAKEYLSPRHVKVYAGGIDEQRLKVHEIINSMVSRLFTESNKPVALLDNALVAEGLLSGDLAWLKKHGRKNYASQVIKYGILGRHLKPKDYSRMFKVAAGQTLNWAEAESEGEDRPYVFERFAGYVVASHLAANPKDKKDLKKTAPQLIPKRRFFVLPARRPAKLKRYDRTNA